METKPIMDDDDAHAEKIEQMRSVIKKLCEYIEFDNDYDEGSSVDLMVKEARNLL
jgi:hypothetical protein